MNSVQIAAHSVLGLALAISVVTDLKTRKIKDFVTFPTALVCLALRAASAGWSTATGPGLASGLLGLAVGAGFFLVFALRGGMGMGDVKLVGAVGAAVGFPVILACLVFIGLAGGVEALAILAWKRRLWHTLAGMAGGVTKRLKITEGDAPPPDRTKIPYGLAIAAGTVWGIWWSLSPAAAGPL